MFSGLYGDLPEAQDGSGKEKKTDSGVSGSWSGTTTIVGKRGIPIAMPPPSVLLQRGRPKGPATVSSLSGRGGGNGAGGGGGADEGQLSTHNPNINQIEQEQFIPASAFGEGIRNEYDPSYPNDYEAVLQRREHLRREAEAEAARQERLKELRALEEMERRREEEEAQRMGIDIEVKRAQDREEARRSALHISGEEAYLRRAGGTSTLSGNGMASLPHPRNPHSTSVGDSTLPAPTQQQQHAEKGMSLAQRMLEKMGWKEGQGLGRSQQGMITPLAVQKTDARSGLVVPLQPIGASTTIQKINSDNKSGMSTPISRVILLRNVVAPGALDAQLDQEIEDECSRYGHVNKIVIFQVTEHEFPEEEAVRIYVEFDHAEGAGAALAALNNRYFGGRLIKATYFDENRFGINDLAPRKDEVV